MQNTIFMCFAANSILLMHNNIVTTSLSCQRVNSLWKQIWWSNDKTIIEFG